MVRSAGMIESPLLLVGSERSGTTLLRLMLDHHPEIAFHFEFEFAVSQIGDDGVLPAVATYRRWLRDQMAFLDSGARINPDLAYPALVSDFLGQKRDRDKKRLVGATIHKHFDRALFVWPDARFIKLVRDGRDVAQSTIVMGWSTNMWCAPERWIEAESLWRELRPKLAREAWIEIRYEELIREPERTLADLCEFIGVTFDPTMFDYARTSTYSLPDPSLVQRWRTQLSGADTQLVEARIGDLLGELGYELSGLPRISLSRKQQRSLERRDRWGKRRNRLQRYGLGLMLADIAARHLPFRELRTRINDRLIAVDRTYAK